MGLAGSNASLRFVHGFADRWGDPDFFDNELADMLTGDFVREDRRRLVGVPGEVGKAEYVEQQKVFAKLGHGSATLDIVDELGTRGERWAATRGRIQYGDGLAIEVLAVWQLDLALARGERLVVFDSDDIVAALTEIDRLHAAEHSSEG